MNVESGAFCGDSGREGLWPGPEQGSELQASQTLCFSGSRFSGPQVSPPQPAETGDTELAPLLTPHLSTHQKPSGRSSGKSLELAKQGPVRGQLSAAYWRQELRPGGWKAASLWESGDTLLGLLQTPGLQLPQVPCSPRGTSSGEATLRPCYGLRLPLNALRPPKPLGWRSGSPGARLRLSRRGRLLGPSLAICWPISVTLTPSSLASGTPRSRAQCPRLERPRRLVLLGPGMAAPVLRSSLRAHSLAQLRVGNSGGSLGAAGMAMCGKGEPCAPTGSGQPCVSTLNSGPWH